MTLSATSTDAWHGWLAVTRSRCHLHFELEGGGLDEHVAVCRTVGRQAAQSIAADIPGTPRSILEVGSSVGFNCLALAEAFPGARVVGIEPDREACLLARAMAADFGITNAEFICGVGENLPFPDSSFDWIVCHTVIEHVNDVDACILEMARVASPGGTLHIDAPNYLWPWEPHLHIFMPPLCPKPLMRLLARLQGAGANIGYTEHLKLVHPAWIERCFRRGNLRWINRMEQKMRVAAAGHHQSVVAYGRFARLLSALSSAGLAEPVIALMMKLRLYPSVLYTATKN